MAEVCGSGSPGTVTPIRVLAVIDSLEVGGAQQHLLTLASGIRRADYELVVATSGDEFLTAAFQREGLAVLSLARRPIKHRFSPMFTTRLAWLALRGDFDLIHAHLHSASLAAAIAARVSGLPLVITHHSMNTWRRGWQGTLGDWADRQANAVIAVATNVAAAVAAHGANARLIPNGVGLPTRSASAAEIAAARARFGIPATAYLISYVGRFTPDKNPLLFVEAVALVAALCPTAYFLMLGDGPLRSCAEARARDLHVDGRIVFAGFQADAAALHQVADVLTLPSNSEGAPLVVLEAMAASRPVVATAVGDVARQIIHGETGFVVAPGDARELANALLALTDAGLRTRFGAAARQRVLQYLTVDRCLAKTAEIYREVLDQRDRARGRPGPVPRPWPAEVPPLLQAVQGQDRAGSLDGIHPGAIVPGPQPDPPPAAATQRHP